MRRILLGLAAWVLATGFWSGCSAPQDAGSKQLMVGSFLGDQEIRRVSDLMARDLVRDPLLYAEGPLPRIAVLKVENNTNQYMFSGAKDAYLTGMRTQLERALGDRVNFVDPKVEEKLRAQLRDWHIDEESTGWMISNRSLPADADYLLAAVFDSLDKVIAIPDESGKVKKQHVIELQMVFSLVDAETAELAWQNSVTSAAAYTTRDFQD